MVHRFVDAGDDGLVKTRRHDVDQIHRLREFAVFLCRHLAGNEDAEMADALMQAIDDGLPGRDDLVLVVVKIEDPAQGLLRRRDVVAPGTEHDDRRLDVAQIDPDAGRGSQFAGRELVADKQIVGDRLHLPGCQQHRAAPPFLEIEKAIRLGVDLRI